MRRLRGYPGGRSSGSGLRSNGATVSNRAQFGTVVTPSPELLARLTELLANRGSVRDAAFALSKWERVVSQIERGYRGTLDHYTNDVSLRSAIDVVSPQLVDELRTEVASILAPLDQRFLTVTSPLESQGWTISESPLCNRVPHVVSAEFNQNLQDLEALWAAS